MFKFHLKKKLLRLLSKIKSKFAIAPDETEVIVRRLIIKVLSLDERSVLFAPISDHILIDSERAKILLTRERIKISNHNQFYEYYLRPQFASEMMMMIKNNTDRERLKLERDIFKSKNEMLRNLIDEITSYQKNIE